MRSKSLRLFVIFAWFSVLRVAALSGLDLPLDAAVSLNSTFGIPHAVTSSESSLTSTPVIMASVAFGSDPDAYFQKHEKTSDDHAQRGPHPKDGKIKDHFHGAEMGPLAMALAGLFAITGYLGVRRRAHRRV